MKRFNLPDILAKAVAERIGRLFRTDLLVKCTETDPAKTTPPERLVDQLRAAHRVDDDVDGEVILLVDDLVRSGTTLATLAGMLPRRRCEPRWSHRGDESSARIGL